MIFSPTVVTPGETNLTEIVVKKIMQNYRVSGLGLTEQDLVQEGMIALIRAKRTYDESQGVKFETYASICIRNRVIDLIRKYGNAPVTHEIIETQSEDGFDRIEREEILARVLSACSELERRIFELYMQGYSYRETSGKLIISTKKIDNTMQKIKKEACRLNTVAS